MYELTSHRGNKLNDLIKIEAHGEPGPGGAHSLYEVYLKQFGSWEKLTSLRFQNQPLVPGPNEPERPPNGLSNEVLLAIVMDRLEHWQFDKVRNRPGEFACPENEHALHKLREAVLWLRERSRGRAERGVEGTLQK